MPEQAQRHRFMQRDIDEELVWALQCESPSLDRVRELVARGADVNATDDLDLPCDCASCRDETIWEPPCWTVLMHAVWSRRVPTEVVRYLIEQGANVNAISAYGHTVLTEAMTNRNLTVETVRLLIQHGADVDQPNGNGYTPLVCILGNRYMAPDTVKIVQLLVEAGADVNACGDRHSAALLRALWRLDVLPESIVEYLAEHGAVIDCSDPELLLQAAMSSPQAVDYLLRYGANPNVVDEDGYTVLDHIADWTDGCLHAQTDVPVSGNESRRCTIERNSTICKLLLQAGAKRARDLNRT